MPIKNYDPEFGGKTGAAQKAHDAMMKEYGAEEGEHIFYATKNKAKGKFRVKSFLKKVNRGG